MDVEQLQANLHAVVEDHRHRFPNQRVLVFWRDPDGEFSEAVHELALPEGMGLLKVNDALFGTKVLLLEEAPEASFLVYLQQPRPRDEQNWLLDLEVQAEAFTADRAAMLVRQFGFTDRSLVDFVREALPFFGNKKRVQALHNVGLDASATRADLAVGMCCVLAGVAPVDTARLLRAVLAESLDEDENTTFQEIVKYVGAERFWTIIREAVGYRADSPSLRDLWISLAFTHLAESMGDATPKAVAKKVIRPSAKAFVFVQNWLQNANEGAAWDTISREMEAQLDVADHIAGVDTDAIQHADTFPIFDRLVIQAAADALVTGGRPVTDVRQWINSRRVRHWHGRFANHYDALEAGADLADFVSQPLPPLSSVDDAWSWYANTGYRADRAYRRFVVASDQVGESLNVLGDHVDKHYHGAFLEPLSAKWAAVLGAHSAWPAGGVSSQRWFFHNRVQPMLDRNDRDRVFVLISDALRYEVAHDLVTRMRESLRGEPTLNTQSALLPSVTKLGMAALLPGAKLSWESDNSVRIDGMSTQGRAQRADVLAASGYSSTLLDIDALLAMSREEARAAIRDARLVYIYQNEIDAAGDKYASERQTFAACERAVTTLDRAIRTIVNQLNGTHVLVTSDHGFLYQRRELAEHEKVPKPVGDVQELNRRYAIGADIQDREGTLRFKAPYLGKGNLEVVVPRGAQRFAIQGPGAQYVHGGASLQEVCLPIITYRHKRSEKGGAAPSSKVGVQVNATAKRITNNAFTIRLVQQAPVGARVKPRAISVQIVDDDDEPVTNLVPLLLDKDAPQATEREFSARLKIGVTDTSPERPYYLVITDTDDDVEIHREQWVIDIAISDDFGDF
ncbi:MAG: BREX-1 system phosphatase PglZ type A [Trueperaceae bacterium]|nr:BREX-1 system phosphatase PglZ type A [Trueperaceae bacterium]